MNRARAAGGATVSRVLSGRAMNVRRTSTAAVRSGALLPRTAAVARRAASSSSSGADMRAVVVTDWVEEPRALRVARTEQPELFDGAVKVKVAAAGVNFFDSLMIAGKYQIKPPLPFVPGGEFSGVVTEVRSPAPRAALVASFCCHACCAPLCISRGSAPHRAPAWL